MKTQKSFCYKQGFKKGLEIFKSNQSLGYFADEQNKRIQRNCRVYSESGYKRDIKLSKNQIDYYSGIADGINYKFALLGIKIENKREISSFEKREYNHYYRNEQ